MVTIYRAHGLRVVIFLNDHEPAHVHVFGDGEAKINLVGANGAAGTDLGGWHEPRGNPPRHEAVIGDADGNAGQMEGHPWLI